jgi:hypothetical protein
MVQLVKAQRVNTGNSKAAVILAGCAIAEPATNAFRFKARQQGA